MEKESPEGVSRLIEGIISVRQYVFVISKALSDVSMGYDVLRD